MRFLKFIIPVVLLVAIGVVASLFLVPDAKTVVQMQEHDQAMRTTGGYTDFRAEYEAGSRSETVMVGLTDLYIGEGRGMDALPILEAHVQENPDHHTARRKLAELYRAAGREEDFLRETEYLAAQAPDEVTLKNLADLYNQAQRYEEQEKVLRQLMQMANNENPDYQAELVATLILLDRKDEADQQLADLQTRFPDYNSYVLTRILVSNNLDRGEAEKALELATEWTSQETRDGEVADLINLIHYGGEPEMALKLAATHQGLTESSRPVFVAYVNALAGAGEHERAWGLMQPKRAASELPVELYGLYIELALLRGNEPEALAVADDIEPRYFSESVALNLIALSYENEYEQVLERLLRKFGTDEFRTNKPALDAVVALIGAEDTADQKIATALDSRLQRTPRLRLAQFCVEFDKEPCFDTIASRFDPVETMSARELSDYVNLYIAADRQADIAERVEAVAARSDSDTVRMAWARLAAANGNSVAVKAWLQRYGRGTPNARLAELFYLANDRGHGRVALPIAEMLYERAPNATYREFLVTAYLQSGQYTKALPVLRQSRNESLKTRNLYLSALTQAARSDAQYREELAGVVIPLIESEQTSSERKLELVYMLINSRQSNLARPYVKQYADSEGGEWKTTWNQMNNVGGGKAVPLKTAIVDLPYEQRLKIAAKASTSRKVKRDIAFSLKDDGYPADATRIFYELAQNQPANSQDVKDLMFLWGTDLNQQQIAWLAHRAAKADNYSEAVEWTNYITTQSSDQTIMDYVTKNPNALSYPGLRESYLTAMAKHSTGDEFTRGLSGWLSATNDAQALKDYADIATAYGYRDAAVQALRKIDHLAPGSEPVLKDLGVMTFNQADYSESQKYLSAYFDKKQRGAQRTSPFEALFYQGQLLWREGKHQEANAWFSQLIARAPAEATTVEKQSMYYTSLFHTGDMNAGRAGFRQLLGAYPENKSLLADFIAVLVEFKLHGEAMAVANQYDPNMRARIPAQGPVSSSNQTGSNLLVSVLRFVLQADSAHAQTPTMTAEQRLRLQQELRLQLLYARMELETGREDDALRRLDAIKPYFPKDAQLLGFTANAENFTGNWPRALQLLENAQTLTPENEDLTQLKRNIERINTSQHVKLDHEWRRIGDSDEQITTLEGVMRPTNDTEIGLVLQNDEVDASGIRRGTDGSVVDQEFGRQRGELYLAHYLGRGDRLQASLFANTDTQGAGLYYAFTNPVGRSEILAEYRRPYWDFVEAVVEETTRDRVGIKHVARLSERLTFSGETSLNNYNTAHEDNAASSYLLRGNFVYELQAQHPYLGVGYGFDGEYFMGKKKQAFINPISGGPDLFARLGHNAREIHFLSGIIAEQWDSTRAELIGGYAYDRLGSHGPQVQATLTQEFTDHLQGQLRARYGLQSNDSDQNYSLVGGHLKVKF